MHASKQYLAELRKEYERVEERDRSRLLDEAQKRTGYNRKYLIRILNREPRPQPVGRQGRRRKAEYGAAVVTALVELWDIFEQPCGQRLAVIVREQVEGLRRLGELKCSEQVADKLREISASTIDRLLRREKRVRMLRRNRNPNVQRLIYQKVPVKVAAEWDTNEIGNVQVDFVLHCGRSTGGGYIHTISAVDIATNWWEGEAIAVRSQQATKAGLTQMRPRFPFRILELHPDNDSALVNDLLWDWCGEQGIRLSRSRPYKKNDNAWVEQKNWTHVRKVVGYRRFDTTTELRLLNEIYGVLRLYKNFFLPTIKLVSKTRVEGRIKRVYDTPRTPYQRVMESTQIDRKTKRQLRSLYETLNPAELHRRLEGLRERLEEASAGKSEGTVQRPYRGPDIAISRRRGALAGAGRTIG
jgi:Integrase core domain